MRRKPCIALLLCFCSCSLDTTPDIGHPSEQDASMSATKREQASLRFDPPLPARKTAVKRARRDDTDAGDGPSDAKPESRDAGRPASDRPAMSSSRDAGAIPRDAGAKQKPTSSNEPPAATGDVQDDSAKGNSPSASTDHATTSLQRDAGVSHSSEARDGSRERHREASSDRHERSDDRHGKGNDDEGHWRGH